MRLIAVLFASLYITSGAWADIPVQAPSETEVTKSTTPAASAAEAPVPATQIPASVTDTQSPVTAPAASPAKQDEPSAPKTEAPTSIEAAKSEPTVAAQAPSEAKPEKAPVDPIALKKAGYKLVNEKGQQLYCREELSTGSHLKKTKTCLTERELDQLMTNTRREIEYMRMRIPPPQGK